MVGNLNVSYHKYRIVYSRFHDYSLQVCIESEIILNDICSNLFYVYEKNIDVNNLKFIKNKSLFIRNNGKLSINNNLRNDNFICNISCPIKFYKNRSTILIPLSYYTFKLSHFLTDDFIIQVKKFGLFYIPISYRGTCKIFLNVQHYFKINFPFQHTILKAIFSI